jgi:hypothetical protein
VAEKPLQGDADEDKIDFLVKLFEAGELIKIQPPLSNEERDERVS